MPSPPRLVWLPEALADLRRHREFIRPHNPAAARRAAQAIKQAAERLRDYPRLGKPVEELPEFYELSTPFGSGSYILRYRLVGPMVVIVAVWHSREDRGIDDD